MPEPFVARVSVPKVVALLACSTVFVVAGIWLITHAGASPYSPPIKAQILGVISIGFGAMSALTFGSLLDLDGPLIEIGQEGLLWRHWSEQPIPWDAIARARVRTAAVQSSIIFSLDEPSLHPPRALRRPVVAFARGLGFGGLRFSNQASDRSFEATLDAIRRFAPHLTLEGYSFPNTAS
jgi:hypothetical protein